MSKEESKALMLELVKQVGQVRELIIKINASSIVEFKKGNYHAPHVLSMFVCAERHQGTVSVNLQCNDVLEIIDSPTNVEYRELEAYPYETSTFINGIKLFELKETAE